MWEGRVDGGLVNLPLSGTINRIMKQILYIKNMVCDRCKSTVLRELTVLGYDIKSVELGQIILNENLDNQHSKLEEVLTKHGFEIMQDNDGFIWVGTDDGLSRFDGFEFSFFLKSTYEN